MADEPRRVAVHVQMAPAALAQLDALVAKLHLNRSAVLHLAVARLAELERVSGETARSAPV